MPGGPQMQTFASVLGTCVEMAAPSILPPWKPSPPADEMAMRNATVNPMRHARAVCVTQCSGDSPALEEER